jgi:hypothetical protein
VGHHAEAAEHVAALHHRDEGATRRLPDVLGVALRQVEALERPTLLDAQPTQTPPRRVHHRRHQAQVVGAEDEVHLAEATQDPVALLLRHAARHPEDPSGAVGLPAAQQAELAVEAMLRLLADRAGVEDQEVGVVQVGRRPVAGMVEEVRHLLRVVDVHLAAVRADQEARHRRHGRPSEHQARAAQSRNTRVGAPAPTRVPTEADSEGIGQTLVRKLARNIQLLELYRFIEDLSDELHTGAPMPIRDFQHCARNTV